jgi:hypothetical protein
MGLVESTAVIIGYIEGAGWRIGGGFRMYRWRPVETPNHPFLMHALFMLIWMLLICYLVR